VIVCCLVRLSDASGDGDRCVYDNGEMAIRKGTSKKLKVPSAVPSGAT
jgi:hypothetical protein